MNLSFVDPSSTMFWTIPSIEGEWNSLAPDLEWTFVFSRSIFQNDLGNPTDERKWSSLISPRLILSFLDQSSTMIWKLSSIESEWNSLLSSWITSLPFLDLRSTMISTISAVESECNSRLFHNVIFLSFQDQSSTMFRTVSPIKKWVKFTCRSPQLNLCVF